MKVSINRTGMLMVAAATAISLSMPITANAADFSGKTVTILVPFAEGGGSDTIGRLFQPHIAKHLPGNPKVIVLNQPGGGGVKGSNKFDASAPNDGTQIIVSSSSAHLAFALGGKAVQYDETKWRGIMGLPRGSIIYANAAKTGVTGKDPKADVAALRKVNVVNGSKTPIAVELTETVAWNMLGIDNNTVFGLSTSKQRQAFWRGEINVSLDGTGVYAKSVVTATEGEKATPLFTHGAPGPNGTFARDPDFPDLPHFAEYYETVTGKKPGGIAYEAYKNLFTIRVALSKVLALPAGTPDDVVDTWVSTMKSIYDDPAVQQELAKEFGGMKPTFGADTERALTEGLKVSAETKDWLNNLLKSKYNAAL